LGDCKNAPCWSWKTEEAADDRNSASSITGGEGGVGEKPEEVELYPLVGSDGVRSGRKEVPCAAMAPVVAVGGGGGVPASTSGG